MNDLGDGWRKFAEKKLVVTSSVVLVLGVAAGVLAGRTVLSPDRVAQLGHGDLCDADTFSVEDVEVVKRALPSGAGVSSSWRVRDYGNSFSINCSIWVHAAGGLHLRAELKEGGPEDWKTGLKRQGDLGGFNDSLSFDGGGKGISGKSHAAVYLKCTPPGQESLPDSERMKNPHLSVVAWGADAENFPKSGGESYRRDIARLAVSMTETAQSAVGCTENTSIPEGIPKLVEER
ncbi:hypothetical protein GCM10010406_51930 [Streptomyces thermolineatus]|uniref:Secreted protein n=1 Tax=Streptomyces thermolineatus TaxID=44033 RepID=A0ABN3MVH9_9ACTN